jgi:hypothetical protein
MKTLRSFEPPGTLLSRRQRSAAHKTSILYPFALHREFNKPVHSHFIITKNTVTLSKLLSWHQSQTKPFQLTILVLHAAVGETLCLLTATCSTFVRAPVGSVRSIGGIPDRGNPSSRRTPSCNATFFSTNSTSTSWKVGD